MIVQFRFSDCFTPREKLAMEYAETITLAPGYVDDNLFERLRAVFTDLQIVELTLVVAAYNLTNRFNLALGVELEPMFEQLLAGR